MTINRYKVLLFSGLSILLLFISCTSSLKTVSIETAKPSSDLLPDQIGSLTLMNRAITGDFRDYDKDSLQRYFYKNGFNVSSIVLDSLAADTTLKVLAELLFASGRYDVVIPQEYNFHRDLKFHQIPEELHWDQVRRICSEFNTDVLLVIERYYNKLITDYTVHPALLGYEEYASAAIDSKYDAVAKIYDPTSETVIRQLLVADTISWYETDTSTERLFRRLPSIKECLVQTGIQVALELDSKLSPTWVQENRSWFLIDKKDFNLIDRFIRENNWQAAYDYWLPFAASSKTSTKSRAEYNLALASEMLGDVDLAIEWANKSYFTQYHKQTENYLYKLKRRKEIMLSFQKLNE
ncbi:MAG: DUF6340 family protein [Mangrovibacterium sp.]